MQQLHHQSGKPLVRPGNSHRGMQFDQNILTRANIDLQHPRLVERTVEKGEEFLMADVRAEFFGITFEFLFAEVAMVVAVEEFVGAAAVFDGFEFGLVEEDDQLVAIAVVGIAGVGDGEGVRLVVDLLLGSVGGGGDFEGGWNVGCGFLFFLRWALLLIVIGFLLLSLLLLLLLLCLVLLRGVLFVGAVGRRRRRRGGAGVGFVVGHDVCSSMMVKSDLWR